VFLDGPRWRKAAFGQLIVTLCNQRELQRINAIEREWSDFKSQVDRVRREQMQRAKAKAVFFD
jgi:hypothetical protein